MKISVSFALFILSLAAAAASDPTAELSALRKQAMGGDAAKTFAFAEALRKAESEEAFEWYVKAADRGHPEAAYLVFEGSFADDGLSIPRAEYDRLLGYLRRAAEGGFAPAQHRLGVFLESYRQVDGQEVPIELEAAAAWYRKAAEQKHPAGMEAWALAQIGGTGVPKDFANGLRDMKAAAHAGSAKAQRYLADLFKSGADAAENKVPVDWVESIRWCRMLIASGEEDTLTLASSLLRRPNPSPADLAEARKLVEAQVADGNPNAQEFVDLLKKVEADAVPAAYRERLAARYQIFEQQFNLATTALGRQRTFATFERWIRNQPYAGVELSESGEWTLRKMTPLLERHPTEAYTILARASGTVLSRELIQRVLPGPLLAAWREGAQRFRTAYDADEKYRAEIRQKYQAAYGGDGAAQLAVALAYLNQSDGRESQWAYAMHWLTLATAKGVPGAADRLNKLSAEINGRFKSALAANDLHTVVELNRQKASSPMADAHVGAYFAGRALLANGKGSAEDIPEAEGLLKTAAEKGYVDAILELGKMYLLQEALPIDEAKALAWFKQAAERNNPEAKAWVTVLTPELGPAERGELAQKIAGERMRVSDTFISFPAAMPFSTYAARLGNDQARAFLVSVAKASSGNVDTHDGPTTLAQDQAGAKAGDAESMRRLGERYEVGDGVAMDDDLAYDWFRRAAERGNAQAKTDMAEIAPRLPAAMYRLAERYEKGDGIPRDVAEALAWYRKAAAAGHEDAEIAVIEMENRIEMDRSFEVAEQQRARKAQIDGKPAPLTAEQVKLQQASLGAFFGDTEGGKKTIEVETKTKPAPLTKEQAAKLSTDELLATYEKAGGTIGVAAEDRPTTVEEDTLGNSKNDPESAFRLGKRYEAGNGTEKNPELALFFYRRAESLGHPRAADAIRQLTLTIGLTRAAQNLPKPATPAAPGPSADGAISLARTFASRGQQEDATKMLQTAAQYAETAGPANKHYLASVLFRGQFGVPADQARAHRLIRESAEAGYIPAQLEWGQIVYQGGPGVKADQTKGQEWFMKVAATETNDAETMMHLANLFARGAPGVPADRARALRLITRAANDGLPAAEFEYGRTLVTGAPDIPPDPARGIGYLEKAANHGLHQAAYVLGEIYEKGVGVPADLAKAEKWYAESSSGMPLAEGALKRVRAARTQTK